MDTRLSALIVGLYVAGIGCIVAVAWGYYAFQQRSAAQITAEVLASTPPAARASAAYPAPATYYQAARAKADESLRLLRASLAETQQLLEQRNQVLSRKNAECQSLKAELDQSVMVILNLLAQDASDKSQIDASASQVRQKLESELARLVDALHQAESLSAEQAEQLSRMRGDLLQADMEYGMLREQAEMEVSSLLAERMAFESLINDVLARCGAAAVPVVAEHLENERVEVRRWAARTMGILGPDAVSAVAGLRRALTDPDAGVRDEAQRSLRVLDGQEVARAAAR